MAVALLQQGFAKFVEAAGQFVQPLFHAQQQMPAQHHGETEVADSAEDFFGIHRLTPVRKR